MQLAGGVATVTENQQSAVVGELVTTDDDRHEKFTYSLVSDGGGPFDVVGKEVRLKSGTSVDYEKNKQFSIRIKVTDGGSPAMSLTKTFIVKVIDVNEAPTNVYLSKYEINENSDAGTEIGTISTKDPDNDDTITQTHIYRLVDDAGGRFAIVNGALKVKPSNKQCLNSGGDFCLLNYEKSTSHRIVIEVTDSGKPSIKKEFVVTIKVLDVNDSPRSLTVSNLLINENLRKGTLIGSLSADDEDSSSSLSYHIISSDGGNFNLSGNQLFTGQLENYEVRSSYQLKLQVRDNGSPQLSINQLFTVTVIDVNERPTSVSVLPTDGQLNFTVNFPKIREHTLAGTAIGTVEVVDVDKGEMMTITLDDDDGGNFRIATGNDVRCASATLQGFNSVCRAKLFVGKTLDYEVNVQHTIIIRATDKSGHGLSRVVKLTVFVVDVNDPPTDVDVASGNPRVHENVNGAVVGEVSVTDQDTWQSHSCQLTGSAGGRFVMVGREVRVSSNANLDYESQQQHTITVQCTDDGTPPLSVTKSFTVKVLDVNEKPQAIHISHDTIPENAKFMHAVGRLSASDPDNSHSIRQTFTWKLVDSADRRFRMDGDILKVAVYNSKCLALGGKWCMLNMEEKNKYDVVVRVTDSGSPPLVRDEIITIHLTDVNDRPRNLDLSSNTVYENDPKDTLVGLLSARNEDKGQTLEYVLVDDDDGKFKIVANELRKALPADYETSTSHSILVTVRDDGIPSLNISRRFVIEVRDVNEPPFNLSIVQGDEGDSR
ncbi:protocadherin beta-14-like [Corticium candelabrum]|uniref:protocadherin beta-14-like n=1 Tax=Corticium candelabrum TaxID=121492 RepID=UPI002E257737|nr:protocadherin beta-14-like [Corticium candelabrum]